MSLSEFLTEIYEARDDAQANGYPIPKKSNVQNAVRLGKDLFDRLPFRYEAYAGANGEVVIDADGNRDSVLVLCEPDGSAVVMSYMDGVQDSTKYSKIGDLPDDSLLEKINSVD